VPWKETGPMEERMKFMLMYQSESWSMTELCEIFGVSRKTGCKWLKRGMNRMVWKDYGSCRERLRSTPTR
jgi:transposase